MIDFGEAELIGIVRYVNGAKIQENFICYCLLLEKTTADQIFGAIGNKMREYKVDWKNVTILCTDGAPAMTGMKNGLAPKMALVANVEFTSSPCILHRETLASKNMSETEELTSTLELALLAVKMINTIK